MKCEGLGLLLAAVAQCSPLPVTLGRVVGDVRTLDTSHRGDGRMLGTMPGAEADDLVVLPSGDVVVGGRARESFVTRVAPDGKVRWTVHFAPCQGLLIAAADDNAIYVLDRAEGTLYPPGTKCDLSQVGDHGVLYRLDARGVLVWRYPSPFAPSWMVASHERVVAGGKGVFSVTPDGHAEWSRIEDQAYFASAAFVDARSLVVGGAPGAQMPGYHPPTYAPCFLRGIDANSGATSWQQELPPQDGWCSEPEVLVAGPLGVVRVHVILDEPGARVGWRLVGFDAATGKTRWEARDPADPEYGAPFTPLLPLEPPFAATGPVLLADHLAPEDVYVPYVVAVDSATGATRPIARVIPSLPRSGVKWIASVQRAVLRDGFVVIAGSFHGSLEAAGLHAESPHRPGKQCFYDVGFPGSPPMGCTAAVEYDQAMFVARMKTE